MGSCSCISWDFAASWNKGQKESEVNGTGKKNRTRKSLERGIERANKGWGKEECRNGRGDEEDDEIQRSYVH